MAQGQRKHRSREERDAVCREVVDQAAALGLPMDSAPMTALFAAFELYTAQTHGGSLEGAIPADELRRGSAIEYLLPGRRVLRPMVRLTAAK